MFYSTSNSNTQRPLGQDAILTLQSIKNIHMNMGSIAIPPRPAQPPVRHANAIERMNEREYRLGRNERVYWFMAGALGTAVAFTLATFFIRIVIVGV